MFGKKIGPHSNSTIRERHTLLSWKLLGYLPAAAAAADDDDDDCDELQFFTSSYSTLMSTV